MKEDVVALRGKANEVFRFFFAFWRKRVGFRTEQSWSSISLSSATLLPPVIGRKERERKKNEG